MDGVSPEVVCCTGGSTKVLSVVPCTEVSTEGVSSVTVSSSGASTEGPLVGSCTRVPSVVGVSLLQGWVVNWLPGLVVFSDASHSWLHSASSGAPAAPLSSSAAVGDVLFFSSAALDAPLSFSAVVLLFPAFASHALVYAVLSPQLLSLSFFALLPTDPNTPYW